jgi:hypothetical protein
MKRYGLIALSLFLMSVSVLGNIPGIDIADDKIAHFTTGALIAKYCHDDFNLDKAAGFSAVFAFSCLKEYIDTQNGGYADENDVKAALLGALCVYVWEDHMYIRMTDNGVVFKIKL